MGRAPLPGDRRTKVIAMYDPTTDPAERRAAWQQRARSMRRWRIGISSAAVVLGGVLAVTGHVLVGAVIGGLAVARLVMFARFRPGVGRRRQWPDARSGGTGVGTPQ